MRRLLAVTVVCVASIATSTLTAAHPHVLPTVRADLVFDADGRMTAIQNIWTYDSMYSNFAARDIDSNKDGTISKDELAAFAESQIEALAEHNYFTTVTAPAGFEFGPAQSVAVEKLGDGRLKLTFTAPFKAPLAFNKQAVIEIFDPNFFAYFTIADGGVRLIGAREACTTAVTGPQPIDLRNTRSIPSVFWQALDGSKAAGQQFVNRITVTCP